MCNQLAQTVHPVAVRSKVQALPLLGIVVKHIHLSLYSSSYLSIYISVLKKRTILSKEKRQLPCRHAYKAGIGSSTLSGGPKRHIVVKKKAKGKYCIVMCTWINTTDSLFCICREWQNYPQIQAF